MNDLHTFADRLHALCMEEVARCNTGSGVCPDAAAAMTTEIVGALANSITMLTLGHARVSREIVRGCVESLPQMVFEKGAIARAEVARMGSGGARG